MWHLALLIVVLPAGPAWAQAPTRQELSDTLRRESEWYLGELRQYQCESENVNSIQPAGELYARITTRCRQRGPCNLQWNNTVAGALPASELVIGVNSRYAFQLQRQPGKEWVLVSFYDLSQVPLPDVFHLRGVADPVLRVMSPYWLGGMQWLPDLLGREQFLTRQIEYAKTAEGPRVIVRYEFPDADREGMTHHGLVSFDPANHWMVTGHEHNQVLKGITKRTLKKSEYEPGVGGLPLTKENSIVITSDLPGSAGRWSTERITMRYTREEADESEFTLSAFGLPEPPGMLREKQTPRYVWLLVVAGSLAILAILFRWFARRRQAAAI